MNGNNGIVPTIDLATNNSYPYPIMFGNSGGNGGFGGFGGDGALWLIVLLALIWGNNGNNGGFFGGNSFNDDYAWLSNGQKEIMQNTNNGFDTLHLSNQLEGTRDAISNISTQLCNGFNDVNTSLLNCCCENRLGIANLNSTILSENCADRQALSEGVRDIIASQVAGTQRILDQMCSDKIDAKNEKIADLERQLTMADFRASQIAQTAQIRAGQVEEVDALYDRLNNCPVGTVPVYGRTPIFSCNNGCGCSGGFYGNGTSF